MMNVIPLSSGGMVKYFEDNGKDMQGRSALLKMEGLDDYPFVLTGTLSVDNQELTFNADGDQTYFGESSLLLVSPSYNNFYRHGIHSLVLR